MRTRSTIQPVALGDKTCAASCTQRHTDPEHFRDHRSPTETADSTDSLVLESSGISDEVLQDQGIHHTSRTDKLTMSVSEAAEWLGISRAFAYELVARGELPSIRLGRRVLVPTKRLFDFVLEEKP